MVPVALLHFTVSGKIVSLLLLSTTSSTGSTIPLHYSSYFGYHPFIFQPPHNNDAETLSQQNQDTLSARGLFITYDMPLTYTPRKLTSSAAQDIGNAWKDYPKPPLSIG